MSRGFHPSAVVVYAHLQVVLPLYVSTLGSPATAALEPMPAIQQVRLGPVALSSDKKTLHSNRRPCVCASTPTPLIPSQLAALYRAPGSAAADALALDVMRTNWAPMVAAEDVGTLWEMFDDTGEVSARRRASPLLRLAAESFVAFLSLCAGVPQHGRRPAVVPPRTRARSLRGPAAVAAVSAHGRRSASAPFPVLLTTLPLLVRRVVAVEPHPGGLPAASGVVGTEFGPVGVSFALTGGAWAAPWPRAVSKALNTSGPPAASSSPHTQALASGVSFRVALPLDDPSTPPPASSALLNAYCLDIAPSGGPPSTLNVTEALASGALSLDASRRFLRYYSAAGAGEVLTLHLHAPPGGSPCSAALAALLAAPPVVS